MRSIHIISVGLLLAAACGDDSGNKKKPDGGVDAPDIDAAPDAKMPIQCAYTEMHDTTNDDFDTGTPEGTGLNFTTTGTAICGQFNSGHYAGTTVDIDSYMIHVPSDTRAILHMTGTGLDTFDFAKIEIYGMTNAIDETGYYTGNHAVTAANLPSGDYEITLSAFDSAAAAASIEYKLTIELDSVTRCAKSSATAFAEAADTSPVDGSNDVIEVRYGPNPNPAARRLTDLATDVPEATNITVAATGSNHITGALSTFTVAPVSQMDSFLDRDTYAVTMGPSTNQLAVRVNWPGNTADLDFFVFTEGSISERATGWYMANTEDEFTTLAVTPGQKYWIWVGAVDGSTGQPINYDVTLCGDTYTP